MSFPIGSHLANGRYRIERILGEGGMGSVYEATELLLKRKVALKVLLPELSRHATARMRMEAEAQAMARLSSAHVVRVNTAFDEGGLLVIDLEYLSGGSLSDRLKQGPVEVETAAEWMGQILQGLEALHAEGLVHRDLKPANVLFDAAGRLKLTDLGIAQDSQRESGYRTRHDANLGTPEYMAPEQVRSVATVDLRVDLYAAGVILYELLTGRVPFAGEAFDVRVAQVRERVDLRPVAERSAALAEVVAKALEKEPEARYASAAAMREAVSLVASPNALESESLERLTDRFLANSAAALAVNEEVPATQAPKARGGVGKVAVRLLIAFAVYRAAMHFAPEWVQNYPGAAMDWAGSKLTGQPVSSRTTGTLQEKTLAEMAAEDRRRNPIKNSIFRNVRPFSPQQ